MISLRARIVLELILLAIIVLFALLMLQRFSPGTASSSGINFAQRFAACDEDGCVDRGRVYCAPGVRDGDACATRTPPKPRPEQARPAPAKPVSGEAPSEYFRWLFGITIALTIALSVAIAVALLVAAAIQQSLDRPPWPRPTTGPGGPTLTPTPRAFIDDVPRVLLLLLGLVALIAILVFLLGRATTSVNSAERGADAGRSVMERYSVGGPSVGYGN